MYYVMNSRKDMRCLCNVFSEGGALGPTRVTGSKPDDCVASVRDVDSVLLDGVVKFPLDATLSVQVSHLRQGCFAEGREVCVRR